MEIPHIWCQNCCEWRKSVRVKESKEFFRHRSSPGRSQPEDREWHSPWISALRNPEQKEERSGVEEEHPTQCARRQSWRVAALGLKQIVLCTPKPALSSSSHVVVKKKATELQLEDQLEAKNMRYQIVHVLLFAATNVITSNNCN